MTHEQAAARVRQTNLLIDNAFSPSASGKTFATFNPATELKLADVAESSAADVDRAVAAARGVRRWAVAALACCSASQT